MGNKRLAPRRGFVLVTMALTTIGVFGVAGLAVDIGRMLIAKNEVQVYCDSAALAAAGALDGTSSGIDRASAAVGASSNKWNFGTELLTGSSVRFATSPAGPWVSSPNPATGYSFVRVSANAPVRLYFLPLLKLQSTFVAGASATAGQMPISVMPRGLAPYTAVSTNTTGPNFGFVAGNSYTIHWPTFNGNRSGCGAGDPAKCFNSLPCEDEPPDSLLAVVNNWGSRYHGYWGGHSNSGIASAVLSGIQLAPLAVGTNIDPLLTAGDKQSEASILDQRASQDTDTSDSTPSAYLAAARHNGRRLLPVAVVNPVDPSDTYVTGFGLFLLSANGSPSHYYQKNTNGNSAYCAAYVGPLNIGSSGPGTGGLEGASVTRLVQ